MVVFESVSADLSAKFLSVISGSVEEKLVFLQGQLGDDYPNIVIQYVCGDDPNVVQIKGKWPEVHEIYKLLNRWLENISASLTSELPPLADFKEAVGSFDKEIPDLEELPDSELKRPTDEAKSPEIKIEKPENSLREDHLVEDDSGEITEEVAAFVRRVCEHCGEPTGKPAVNHAVQTEDKTPGKKRGRKKKNPKKFTEPKRKSARGLKQITRFKSEPEDVDLEGIPLDEFDIDNLDKSADGSFEDDMKPKEKLRKKKFSRTKESGEGGEDEDLYDNDDDNDEEVDTFKDELDDSNLSKSGRAKLHEISYLDFPLGSPGEYENDGEEPVITGSTRGRKKRSELVGMVIPVSDVPKLMDEILSKAEEKDGEVQLTCTLCKYKTNNKRHLKPHIRRCHVPQTNACPICNKSYSMSKDLRYHMKTHYPEHICRLCNRKFPSKSILQLHQDRYHSEAREKKRSLKGVMLKCDLCDYTNDQIKNLKDHQARHHQDKLFPCPRCDKSYALKKDLATHLKYHDASYTCEICGKSLRSKMALKVHVNAIHNGIKNTYKKEHMCDHCGKICRSKTHYTEHLNKEHLNHRPFGCPLCKMTFYSNASLRSHLKTHTTERKFTCDKCAKSFKHHTSLKMHQATHMDYHLRPFACGTCKKTFSQKGALLRHERIHTGEKPYKCRVCDGAFTDYSILRRHMLGVHKINSRNLCQRKDRYGNKGGPKPEKAIVEDVKTLKAVINKDAPPPGEHKPEDEDIDEDVLALIAKSKTSTPYQNRNNKYSPLIPKPLETPGHSVSQPLSQMKPPEPVNVAPISSYHPSHINHTMSNSLMAENMFMMQSAAAHQNNHRLHTMQDYFGGIDNGNGGGGGGGHQMHPQNLSSVSLAGMNPSGYTVLQPSHMAGMQDLVGSGVAGVPALPFAVQTLQNQSGDGISIQIVPGQQH